MTTLSNRGWQADCPQCVASKFTCDQHYLPEPDEAVWLRDLDGTGSMHVCTPHCPGAVKYVRADLALIGEI